MLQASAIDIYIPRSAEEIRPFERADAVLLCLSWRHIRSVGATGHSASVDTVMVDSDVDAILFVENARRFAVDNFRSLQNLRIESGRVGECQKLAIGPVP